MQKEDKEKGFLQIASVVKNPFSLGLINGESIVLLSVLEREEKNKLIQQMETAAKNQSNGNGAFSQLTPEMLKEKAKKIINIAKQHAEQHKASAAKELDSLQIDIQKLQLQKQQLMDNIRTTAVEHLNKFKAGTQNGNAGNSVQD